MVQLMLAAWYREDHFCIPLNRIVERKVRSCIAGMQRNHHIYIKRRLVAVNIAHLKAQPGIAVFFSSRIAVYNHVFF